MSKNSPIREVAARIVDDTCGSLAYCVSGWLQLFIGGLFVVLCYVAAGIPLLLGYMHECLTSVMAGNERLPELRGIRAMFGNGLRVLAIGLVYGALIILPFAALLLAEIFTLPGMAITRPPGAGDFMGYNVRYSGFSSTAVIITVTSMAMTFTFMTLFSNAWLRYAIYGSLRSALNPVKTLRWTVANPELLLSKMFSFGIIGLIFAIPGLLIAAVPGIDRTYSLPFILFTAISPWLFFAGLASNTFLRGRQIRYLRKDGKLKSAD
ncbi:DUF4013 domain-containing protein [Methanocella sp. MCL-LM]|uniref:DUF4013 domain-containing protein n=1 Tax=Methanocella sp. MCL-LM TaxID=3412035 RepID=UPI003C7515A0